MIKAKIHGGPFDGREMTFTYAGLEMELDDASSGRIVRYRYVLHYTDKHDVHHYYLPTGSAPGGRPST